jgi:putative hydrolase of the HAD superfamily
MRAVLLDAGNTIIHARTSVGEVYAFVARRHGVEADARELDRAFHAAFRRRKEAFVLSASNPHSPDRERAWWRDVVREAFRCAGSSERLEPLFDSVFDDLYRSFEEPEVWTVFPDVVPCLDVLERRGVPVAVLSNWDSRLHRVLAGLDLHRRFRFVLTSAEFGAEKPDPSIFLEASRRFGLAPDEIVHVGDLEVDDLQGARAAGMRALLLDRGCLPGGGGDRICTLEELPARLEES